MRENWATLNQRITTADPTIFPTFFLALRLFQPEDGMWHRWWDTSSRNLDGGQNTWLLPTQVEGETGKIGTQKMTHLSILAMTQKSLEQAWKTAKTWQSW